MNVLVTCGGGFQGLAVVKELSSLGFVKIYIADYYEENVTKYFSHRAIKVLPLSDPGFVKSLLEICVSEEIALIIPSTNLEVSILAEAKKLFFDKGIHVAVSSPDILKTFLDKEVFYKYLKSKNQPVLPVLDLNSQQLVLPVIGKPRHGWGSTGIVRIHNDSDLKQVLAARQNDLVWQRMISSFDEISIDFAIGFNSRVSEFNMRKRVRTSGGFAVVMETVQDENLTRIATNFAEIIALEGAVGIFNLQVLQEQDDYYISDINPRIGTSSVMFKVNDNNLCRFLINSFHDTKINEAVHKPAGEYRIIRYLEELNFRLLDIKDIRCIVFDLDDTLMPQKKWMAEKLKLLHEKFKDKLPPGKEFLLAAMTFVEEGQRKLLIDLLIEKFKIKLVSRDELIDGYKKATPAMDLTFRDTYIVLLELKKKYKLALLTDNPVDSQKQKLATTRLESIFDVCVFTNSLGLNKPDKEAFIEVARKVALKPQELAMVGDNLYRDVSAALSSDYGHAFYLKKAESMFNFDEEIFKDISESPSNFTTIHQLKDLLWYL